jgi:hypothetical protein
MSEEIKYKVPEGVSPETSQRKKKQAVSANGQLGHKCDHGCEGCGCGGC